MDGVKRYVANLYHGEEVMFYGADVVLASAHDDALAREAALREELAEIKESLAYRGSLLNRTQQRAEAAEQRIAELVELLRSVCADSGLWYQEFGEPSSGEYTAAFVDAEAALKPIESGASHTATRVDQ